MKEISTEEYINWDELNSEDKKYLKGTVNSLIRYYFYLQQGLYVTGQFHTITLGIIAIILALKIVNPVYMALIFVFSLPILILLGRYNLHRLSKRVEWLNMRFGTHYGIKSFNYQKGQYELLEEIRDLLKNVR